ncbi:MAG: histidine phosphatase family protein [Candidatus Fimivivens sp.]|nr:histidine phosphatase family protein [Candidatus Fimivivens sp.]
MNFPIKLVLVRHSITAGNLAGQYIGSTDQPLCQEGVNLAKSYTLSMPHVDRVYCSPMLRCRQTAALLFPSHVLHEVANLREIDFGIFEGKTYAQLSTDPNYQKWIDSAGAEPPPEGESTTLFSNRCVASFRSILNELTRYNIGRAACVIHGGSIMSIMAALASPKRQYYDWQVDNCCGFIVNADPKSGQLMLLEHLNIKREI